MAGIKNINELSELTSEAKSDIKRMLDINEQGGGGSDSGDNNSPWESGTGENSVQLKNVQSVASGIGSVAIGRRCEASGNYSHVEGDSSYAEGNYSHAEGCSSASADYAHSEGADSGAYGRASHAEGQSEANGANSHAEGYSLAGLSNAFDVENHGIGMHAEGESSAYGSLSHSEGECTKISGKATHCGGRYNIDLNSNVIYQPDSYGDYAEIIGNGTTNGDSNARTLTWSGIEWTQGGYETDGYLTLGKGTADEVTLSASDLKQLLNLIYNN